MADSTLLWQSLIVATEIEWPARLKILTIGPFAKKKKVGDPDFAKSEGGLQLPDGVPPWSLSSDQGGECPFSMIAPRHLRL